MALHWAKDAKPIDCDIRWPQPAAAWGKISVPQPETEVRTRSGSTETYPLDYQKPVASDNALAHQLCRNKFVEINFYNEMETSEAKEVFIRRKRSRCGLT